MGTKKAGPVFGPPSTANAPKREGAASAPASAANDTDFDELLELVRDEFGSELPREREAALRRRADRRRRRLGLPTEQAYLEHLRTHPAELRQLQGAVQPSRDARLLQLVQALQASEARARLLFETTPLALMVVDPQGCIERANPQAEALFGLRVSELIGLPIEALLPAGLDAPPQALGTLHGSTPDSRVLTARRADGLEFPVQVKVGCIDEAERRSTIVAVHDISLQAEAQRVLAEHQSELERRVDERSAAVQRAEAQLRLILESTADGLYGVDARGRITFINAAACQMLGVAADALMGQPAALLLQPTQHDGSPFGDEHDPLMRTLRTGEPTRVERASYRRPDGRHLPVVYEVRAMWREQRIVGAVVSFSDITERVAAEAAREAALAEARRLAQVRTEFLTNMSHEIRTPLNAVLGLAEVASRGDRDRPPEETFRMILDAGQVLLGVVNDVLDFARIEAGKLRVESQLFELGSVIDRAVTLVAPRVFAKGLHFTVHESPQLPRKLLGDPLRLTQVLGNLLSNALKFTEEGSIQLRVWCDLHDLWFAVTDSGIGIHPEQMSRLFTPFEQVDSSTTRRFGGSGLGLVISKHLMELMGGAIMVRSALREGSTFSLRLPLNGAVADASPMVSGRVVLCSLIDVDHVPEVLQQRGLEVDFAPAEQVFRQPAVMTVLPVDAMQDEPLLDRVIEAVQQGQRVALLTHPLAAELPPALRGKVVMLEQPLRARHLLAMLTGSPASEVPSATSGRLAGIRVLAAEDNEVNALVLEAILRMEGAQLLLVENGRRAVERVREDGPSAFDIVLTDIQMPEMDGYAATRQILKIDASLPIVGLTAHAMPEERDRCLAAGMVDHVAKPIEVEQLVTTVLRHARHHRSAEGARP